MHFSHVNPHAAPKLDFQTADPFNHIEGMLYCYQISPVLIERLNDGISALNLDKAIQWQDNSGLRRQTFEFGISFREIEQNGNIIRYNMPPFLTEARRELVELFKKHLSEKDPEKYENCILTIYSEGDGIKAHIDREYFGPDILGLIILPDCSTNAKRQPSTLHFFNPKSNEQVHLLEQEGTAFLFQGILRTQWKHELSPVATKRIAIQFRTVNEALIKKV